MYRALEVNFIWYLALYKFYITTFIEKNQLIKKDLKGSIADALTEVQEFHASKNVSIVQNHQKILDAIRAIEFSKEFDSSLKNQCKFYRETSYVYPGIKGKELGASIVQFALAMSIFFAFDMNNYACMTTVYLSQMFKLKKRH